MLKMVGHTLKILQQMLQDFENVFDQFWTLTINRLNLICPFIKQAEFFFAEAHSEASQTSKMELFYLSVSDVCLSFEYASVSSQILF